MSYLKNLEQDYVLGNLEVYREFDSSHFISNAKSAITNKAEAVNMNMKFNYYTNMLEKAIGSFSAIKINKDVVKDFLSRYQENAKLDKCDFTMKEIVNSEIGKFKPQYISQYITMVQVLIDNVIKGEATQNDVNRFMSGVLVDKVEAQVVKTNLTYGVTPKELIREGRAGSVKVDSFYIKTKVIPFVTNYDKIRQETIVEANSVINAIRESCDSVKAMLGAIENIKSSNRLEFDRVRQLNQVAYNTIRGIIDIISYVSYLMIRKINNISTNVISCNELYMDLSNYFNNNINESAFDQNILPTDTSSLAESLIKGNVDVYDTFSKNIYDFHKNTPSTNMATVNMDEKLNLETSQEEYNKDIYNEIGKAFISISSGLDILGSEGDDYLLVFEDVLQKAGFSVILEERFQNELRDITNISEYESSSNLSSVNGSDARMQRRLLAEIRDYSENMKTISNIIFETHKKLLLLTNRFNNNINGEYTDMETTNEIKIFLKSLDEQFINMTEIVAQNFFTRLKTLGNILTVLNANDKNTENVVSVEPVETSSSMDISESVFESILSEYEEDTKLLFEALESAYFIEKSLELRGVKVIFEEEEASTNNPTDNDKKEEKSSKSTKVSITDNNKNTSSKANSSSISVNVFKFVDDALNTLISKINDSKIIVNGKSVPVKTWIKNNKDGILSRDYDETTVNVLPYYNMKPEEVISDINKVKKAVMSLSQDNLAEINSKDELYKKIFTFTSIREEKGPISDQLSKYYKVKDADLELVKITNGQLKTEMSNCFVPYCEMYVGNYKNKLESSLKGLAEAVEETVKSYDISKSEDNKGESIKEKTRWISEAVKKYAGSILNASRDKYRDCLKILTSLAPKEIKDEEVKADEGIEK